VIPVNKHRLWQLLADGALVALAWWLAFELRFDKGVPVYYETLFRRTIGIVVAIDLVVFVLLGFYNRWWRYVSTRDMWRIVYGVTLASLVSDVCVYLVSPVHQLRLPRGIAALAFLLTLAFIAGSRLLARTLMERPDLYSPLFAVDKRNGDVLWELWIEGFEKVVKLRPAAWQRLLRSDAETATAMRGMLTLVDVASSAHPMPKNDSDAVTAVAPDNIARYIVTLNAWRIANSHPMQSAGLRPQPPFASGRKIGRNDPCPCGSGKKYKKCCGLN